MIPHTQQDSNTRAGALSATGTGAPRAVRMPGEDPAMFIPQAPSGGRPTRRPRAARNPRSTAAAMGMFLVAVLAIGVAGWLNGKRSTNAPQGDPPAPGGAHAADPAADSPFADIPRESAPAGRSGAAANLVSRAPESLVQDPGWVAAKEKAQEAYRLSTEAESAKKAGDDATYRARAVAAREIMDQVTSDTAEWEESIVQRYGDDDVLVAVIQRERGRWFDLMRKYHGLRVEPPR